jgi:maltose O-acetyltransferase
MIPDRLGSGFARLTTSVSRMGWETRLPKLNAILRHRFGDLTALKSRVLAHPWIPMQIRARAHRVHPTARIYPRTHVSGKRLSMGPRSFVNAGCFLEAIGKLTLGADVHLGPGVQVLTTSHELGPSTRRAGPHWATDTTIGDGCWIGAGAIVLPGVTIAPGCVIAAGAVVTADCEPDGLYAGVPASRKRTLP